MKEFFSNLIMCSCIVFVIGLPYTMYLSGVEYEKGFRKGLEIGKLNGDVDCVTSVLTHNQKIIDEISKGRE